MDLQFGDSRIQAERARPVHQEKPDGTTTRRIEAAGNVVFLRGEERLSGEQLVMDLGTGQGTFENASATPSRACSWRRSKIERRRSRTPTASTAASSRPARSRPRAGTSRPPPPRSRWTSSIMATQRRVPVKQVPAFYIPYFVYPIQEDQRSTGFLFPHFGSSTHPRLQHRHAGSSGPWAAASTRPSTSTTTPSTGRATATSSATRCRRPRAAPSAPTSSAAIGRRRLGARLQLDRGADAARARSAPTCSCRSRATVVPGAVPGQPRLGLRGGPPRPRRQPAARLRAAQRAAAGRLVRHLLPRRRRVRPAHAAPPAPAADERLAARRRSTRAWCSATRRARRTSAAATRTASTSTPATTSTRACRGRFSLSFLQVTPEVQVRGTALRRERR